MANLFSPFKVGLLILIALSSFIYFSANVKSSLKEEGGNYSVYFYLNDATGLTSKSRVTIAGITVGEISNISLSGNKAKVELIIKKGTTLHVDAAAFKKNSSILGDSYIELTTGFNKPFLNSGQEIKQVHETSSMGGMMNKFDSIASDIKDMTSSLKEIVADQATSGSIKTTVQNLEKITTKLDLMLKNNDKNLNEIMTNMKDFTASIKSMPDRYDRNIKNILADTERSVQLIKEVLAENKEQMKHLIGSANKILDHASPTDINKTIKNLEKVSASLRNVLQGIENGEGSAGKLLKSDKLHDDVEYIVDETSGFVDKVSSVDLIVDAHSEYLFNEQSGNHVFGLRIQPRPHKFYYLGINASPYRVLNSKKTYYFDTGDKQATLNEDIFQENTISFTAYMAYRLYFMTLNYGIFNSTAGMKIDFSFFDDSLVLTTRFNEFSTEEGPNLKVGLRYYPFDTWFINFGSIYLLDDRRDFYLGIGATFTDEDIKSVLTFGSLSSAAGSMSK